jgi:hypothetical protein
MIRLMPRSAAAWRMLNSALVLSLNVRGSVTTPAFAHAAACDQPCGTYRQSCESVVRTDS